MVGGRGPDDVRRVVGDRGGDEDQPALISFGERGSMVGDVVLQTQRQVGGGGSDAQATARRYSFGGRRWTSLPYSSTRVQSIAAIAEFVST